MATSLSEKKIREGLSFLKEADKCLQTSWLKWKPDYDNAADKFMKAGTSFKVGKSYDQAKDAFLKAADVHSKNHSLFHSGKALEQGAAMLKEMKKLDEAAELLHKAGSLYQEHGTPDTAALVFIKAAKMCEGTNIKKAVELYQLAGELRECSRYQHLDNVDHFFQTVLEYNVKTVPVVIRLRTRGYSYETQTTQTGQMDEKLREAAEPYGKVTQLLIKQQKFEEVVKSMLKQLQLHAKIGNSAMQFKVILGLTVVYLSQSDYVAADKCFKDAFDVGGFGTSDEAEAIEDLLQAYDQSDAEQIKSIVSKPLFRNLDNELSKLARDLKPSEEFSISQQHTELRLLSGDIAKLQVDESKPGSDNQSENKSSAQPPGQRLEIDEDEENPLGSEEREGGLEFSGQLEDPTHVSNANTSNEKPSEAATTNDEVSTAHVEPLPSSEQGENTGESSKSKENVTEEPGDDDFESGLC